MTTGMEDSATQLVTVHHDKSAEVALDYVRVAVVAIDDGARNRIGDVAPADGKRLKMIVSNIDRNGESRRKQKSFAETFDLLCFDCIDQFSSKKRVNSPGRAHR